MMAEETATLAAYVADLKFADIPLEVLARAKVLTLDFLGSAIRARRDAESTPSLRIMRAAFTPPRPREPTAPPPPRQSCSDYRNNRSSRRSASPAARPRAPCNFWSTAPGTSATRLVLPR